MPTYSATCELLAPREDVWGFLAEPHHFADWWPGVAGVHPDRLGLAPGARWSIHGGRQPSLLRRPESMTILLVREVEWLRRVSWHMTKDRLDVELELTESAWNRTAAVLTITGPFLVGLRRSLPRNALNRLHALCQTAAEL
jgi:uncharacterized protein YndB with AHSA1/START domain